jgi:hypothetical protein
MAVHIAPKVLHVRFYEDGVDVDRHLHEMKAPYLAHMIVMINDLGVGRVEGFEGFDGFGIREFRKLAAKLRPYGITRLEWRHDGREKSLNLQIRKNRSEREY